MTHHGQLYLRDQAPPRSTGYAQGKFGRLFPSLPPFASDTEQTRAALLDLGKPGGLMDAGDVAPPNDPLTPNPDNPDNPTMTAGMTFLGQFLDHDITFDPTSSLERQEDPEAVENFRVPTLGLDSLYGSGRAVTPHLYDQRVPGAVKLLVDEAAPKDLPRNSQNVALTGDPRNDENLIVSQLHRAFVGFHNAVVDRVLESGIDDPNEAFTEAQRLVRWHYQWIVVHEFLPKTVGQSVVDDVFGRGRRFYNWRHKPFIPVEFSVAAYRFGHSQIRPGYIANFAGDAGGEFRAHIFDAALDHNVPDPDDLSGGKRAPRRFIDWPTFFDLGDGRSKPNKRIDTKLSTPLFTLPFVSPNLPINPGSLAQRNLLRHLTFSLPSGQDVARAMRVDPIARSELADVRELGFDRQTPLWFYVLREADVVEDGERLGPMGGRLVAEVLIGLLLGDRLSYLRQEPDWTPTLSESDHFEIADLLVFAGVAERTS